MLIGQDGPLDCARSQSSVVEPQHKQKQPAVIEGDCI